MRLTRVTRGQWPEGRGWGGVKGGDLGGGGRGWSLRMGGGEPFKGRYPLPNYCIMCFLGLSVLQFYLTDCFRGPRPPPSIIRHSQ